MADRNETTEETTQQARPTPILNLNLPPPPPSNVVPTLYNQELRDCDAAKEAFYCFLATTKRSESPSSALGPANDVDMTDVFRLIFEFVKFKVFSADEGDYHYKVRMQMCHGTENVFAEALYQKGGWKQYNSPPTNNGEERLDGQGDDNDVFCGVLLNKTHGVPFHEESIAELAQLRNQDGSYYTEGQLRSYYREAYEIRYCDGTGMAPCLRENADIWGMLAGQALPPGLSVRAGSCEFCEGTTPITEVQGGRGAAGRLTQYHRYHCGSRCVALPGDLLYWKFVDPYRIAFRWESATDEELVERGYIHPGMIGQQVFCTPCASPIVLVKAKRKLGKMKKMKNKIR